MFTAIAMLVVSAVSATLSVINSTQGKKADAQKAALEKEATKAGLYVDYIRADIAQTEAYNAVVAKAQANALANEAREKHTQSALLGIAALVFFVLTILLLTTQKRA